MKREDEHEYVWDGSDPGWALFRLDQATELPERYLIVHTTSRQALVIDDDLEHDRVVQRMLDEGVRVLSDPDEWARES